MKKVFVNARFLTQQISGVQRYAIEQSINLNRSFPNIFWVAPDRIHSEHRSIAMELNVIVFGNLSGHLWEQIELPIFLKQNGDPILLNLCNTAPLFYSKNIVTIHDVAFLRNPKWFSRTFRVVYGFLLPRIAKNAMVIITVSLFSKEELVSCFKVSKQISVVPNGVSTFFADVDYSINTNEKYILFVGSLDPRKNLVNLLRAMEGISSELKLKIIGASSSIFSKDDELSQLIKNVNVEFLGYVSDSLLRDCYVNAVAFVYPSLYEGFGLPPLEAQALGVPVVVSDIAVFHEIFGNTVTYCNPIDPQSISEAINRISRLSIEDLQMMKGLGIKNAQRYTWINSSRELIKVLTQLLENE